MNIRAKKLANVTHLLLLLVFVAAVFIALSIGAYYCHPNCEDISLSQEARDTGWQSSIRNTLVDYDGRYFTNFLHTFNPLVINWTGGYKWMPILGVILFIFSLTFFSTAVIERGQRITALFLCSSFFAIYFVLDPSVATSVFLMIGSFVYLWAWSFTFLWLGAYLRYIPATTPGRQVFWYIVTTTFLFCCIGMNEMFLITNSLALTIILIWSCRLNKFFSKVLPILMIGLVSIFFFLSSPGILSRLADNRMEGASFIFYPKLKQSLVDFWDISISLLDNAILSLAVIGLFPLFSKLKWNTGLNKIRNTHLFLIVLALQVVAYLMTLAFYIPMQAEGGVPYRIFSSTAVLQIFSFTLCIGLLWKLILSFLPSFISRQLVSLVTSILLVIALLFSENNFTAILNEYMLGILNRFDQGMNSRYAELNSVSAKSGCYKVATIDFIESYPSSIFYCTEIGSNRIYPNWNRALEAYFGVDEVRLKGDTVWKYNAVEFMSPLPQIQLHESK